MDVPTLRTFLRPMFTVTTVWNTEGTGDINGNRLSKRSQNRTRLARPNFFGQFFIFFTLLEKFISNCYLIRVVSDAVPSLFDKFVFQIIDFFSRLNNASLMRKVQPLKFFEIHFWKIECNPQKHFFFFNVGPPKCRDIRSYPKTV